MAESRALRALFLVLAATTTVLGCGGSTDSTDPRRIVAIHGGERHLCALRRGGGATCVQVEDSVPPTVEDDPERIPTADSGDELPLPESFSGLDAIVAGRDRSCGLRHDGALVCVGHAPIAVTVAPPEVHDGFAIGIGSVHLAVARDGDVVDVFDLRDGQLSVHTRRTADGHLELSDRPSHPDLGSRFGCAIVGAGSVECWGSNWSGECGDGGDGLASEPVRVVSALDPGSPDVARVEEGCVGRCANWLTGARELVIRGSTACVRFETGRVACWGASPAGLFLPGEGDRFARRPVIVADSEGASGLCLGASHLCVLRGHEVRCRGSLADEAGFQPIDDLEGATAITCTESAVCGLDARGRVRCEGSNDADDVRLR